MSTTSIRFNFLFAIAIIGGIAYGAINLFPSQGYLLYKNRRLWASKNISNYEYTMRFSNTGGPISFKDAVRLEVRTGKPFSATFQPDAVANYQKPLAGGLPEYDTMDKIFQLAEKTIQSNSDGVGVKYDPVYGYPTFIGANPSISKESDEYGYLINLHFTQEVIDHR